MWENLPFDTCAYINEGSNQGLSIRSQKVENGFKTFIVWSGCSVFSCRFDFC